MNYAFDSDELVALRSSKPEYTERRTTDSIPIPPIAEDPSIVVVDISDTMQPKEEFKMEATTPPVDHMEEEGEEEETNGATTTTTIAAAADDNSNDNDDDDSNEQVVSDEIAQTDQDLLTEEENGEELLDFEVPMPQSVSLVFQQILTLNAGTASGQVAINVVTDSGKHQHQYRHPIFIVSDWDMLACVVNEPIILRCCYYYFLFFILLSRAHTFRLSFLSLSHYEAAPVEATIKPTPPAAPVAVAKKIIASITQNGRQVRDKTTFLLSFTIWVLVDSLSLQHAYTNIDLQPPRSRHPCWLHGHCRRPYRSHPHGGQCWRFQSRPVSRKWSDRTPQF